MGSERTIPVHPELIKLGVLEYFIDARSSGHRFVFHDLGEQTDKGISVKSWSPKWRRIQQHSGFDHPKKSFHSFRHTFKRACRYAKIPEEVHDAFTGHASPATGRKYGGNVPLNVLAEYMETLSYPDLDLSHLYERSDLA